MFSLPHIRVIWLIMLIQLSALPAPFTLARDASEVGDTQAKPDGTLFTTTPTYQWVATSAAIYRWRLATPAGQLDERILSASNVCRERICSFTPTKELTAGSYTWSVLEAPESRVLARKSFQLLGDSCQAGSLTGELTIGETGQAIYRLPLQIPPGTAGMEPDLALVYDSRAGQDLLGVGWSLDGPSAITRCRKTIAQDNERGSIQYRAGDRFCLDGQRLVAVRKADGTELESPQDRKSAYGCSGTEYRTEPESFSRVISWGGWCGEQNFGPAYFEVRTRSGSILHFGLNEGRIEGHLAATFESSTPPRVWALDRIEDRSGNRIDLLYGEASDQQPPLSCLSATAVDPQCLRGDYWLDEIRYTANPQANLSPYNRVLFAYEPLPPNVWAPPRLAGGRIAPLRKRLRSVTTESLGKPILHYDILYETSASTNRSRVKQVQACDASMAGPCLPATTLTWQDAPSVATFDFASEVGIRRDRQYEPRALFQHDFDGDGRADVLDFQARKIPNTADYHWYPVVRLARATDTGGVTFESIEQPDGHDVGPYGHIFDEEPHVNGPTDNQLRLTGDYDGDGDSDLLVIRVGGGMHLYVLDPATSLFTERWSGHSGGHIHGHHQGSTRIYADRFLPGDFDGDGRQDLLQVHVALAQVALTLWRSHVGLGGELILSRSPAAQRQVMPGASGVHLGTVLAFDVDGDMRSDVVRIYRKPGAGPLAADIIYSHESGLDAHPQSVVTVELGGSQFDNPWDFRPLDANGDGLLDLLRVSALASPPAHPAYGFRLHLNSGDRRGPFPEILSTKVAFPHGSLERLGSCIGDFNGDGLDELVFVNDKTNPWAFTAGLGPSPEPRLVFKSVNISHKIQLVIPQNLFSVCADFNGDGKTDLVQARGLNPSLADVLVSRGSRPDLLKRIVDGVGHEIQIAYRPMTDRLVYLGDSPLTGHEPRTRHHHDSRPLVHTVLSSDGVGGLRQRRYGYEGAKYDPRRDLFLGFETIHRQDLQTRIATVDSYHQKYPLTGRPRSRSRTIAIGNLTLRLDATDQTWSESTSFLRSVVQLREERRREWEPSDGSLVNDRKTSYTYDRFGNVFTTHTDWDDGHQEFHSFQYHDDESTWNLGLPINHVIDRVSPQHHLTKPDQSFRSEFTYRQYDLANRQLLFEQRLWQDSSVDTTTSYQRDAFGNAVEIRLTAADPPGEHLQAKMHFDPQGRFPVRQENALGHVEETSHDRGSGQLTRATDANGLVTEWSYDIFGRSTKETRPDGTITTWSYCAPSTAPAGEVPDHAAVLVTVEASGRPPLRHYLDRMQREIRVATEGFGGELVLTDTRYDHRGLVERASAPRFADDHSAWTSYLYDLALRPQVVTAADGTTTTYSHHGASPPLDNVLFSAYPGLRARSSTNAQGRVRRVLEDRRNRAIQVQESNPAGDLLTKSTYEYDSTGNLVRIADFADNVLSMSYDEKGRNVGVDDPDRGLWTFRFDGLDRLVERRDAVGNLTRFRYDLLNRQTGRTFHGATGEVHESRWHYDSSPFGIGLLEASEGPGGFGRIHLYDQLSRPSKVVELRDRGTTLEQQYELQTTYDALGRPRELIYPRVPIDLGSLGLLSRFRITRTYAPSGHLERISKTDDGTVLWKLEQMNARGQVTAERFGNGLVTTRDYDLQLGRPTRIRTGVLANSVQDLEYSYDSLGRLTRRTTYDSLLGILWRYDDLTYDALDRLTRYEHVVVAGQSTLPQYHVDLAYDPIGNLVSKSGVGGYTYSPQAPHAVRTAGPQAFSYDANGNMTGGAGRSYTFAPSNRLRSVSDGATTITFHRDPDVGKIRQEIASPEGLTTIDYVGGVYEKVTMADGSVEHRHHVGAVDLPFAIFSQLGLPETVPAEVTNYLHRDILGSLDAITDEQGAPLERFSFDPHGSRRTAAWQSAPPGSITTPFRHGFTGHEHLDVFNLVDMGGRVYDPALGRFISPDPLVQDPYSSESLNRYTYAWNNPLTFVDPTGFVTEPGTTVGCLGCTYVPELDRWLPNLLPEVEIFPDSEFDLLLAEMRHPADATRVDSEVRLLHLDRTIEDRRSHHATEYLRFAREEYGWSEEDVVQLTRVMAYHEARGLGSFTPSPEAIISDAVMHRLRTHPNPFISLNARKQEALRRESNPYLRFFISFGYASEALGQFEGFGKASSGQVRYRPTQGWSKPLPDRSKTGRSYFLVGHE